MTVDDAKTGFRNQLLWQKSQAFALALVSLVRDLPNDKAADSIGRQLIRSGTSIGANIAEGYGRFSQGAYRNHLSIARGSAFETESWIDLLVQSNYVSREIGDELLARCVELQKLISYRMKALETSRPSTIREEGLSYGVD